MTDHPHRSDRQARMTNAVSQIVVDGAGYWKPLAQQEDTPVVVGIVFGASARMKGKLEESRAAVGWRFEASKSRGRIFSGRVQRPPCAAVWLYSRQQSHHAHAVVSPAEKLDIVVRCDLPGCEPKKEGCEQKQKPLREASTPSRERCFDLYHWQTQGDPGNLWRHEIVSRTCCGRRRTHFSPQQSEGIAQSDHENQRRPPRSTYPGLFT